MSNEQLLAQMATAGVPPDMVEFARHNPTVLAELQKRLAGLSLQEGRELQGPEVLAGEWEQEMKAARERYEQDKRTAPYKIPAPPRDALVDSQRRERAALEQAVGQSMMSRSYCGIPKSFSSAVDLASLTRGE